MNAVEKGNLCIGTSLGSTFGMAAGGLFLWGSLTTGPDLRYESVALISISATSFVLNFLNCRTQNPSKKTVTHAICTTAILTGIASIELAYTNLGPFEQTAKKIVSLALTSFISSQVTIFTAASVYWYKYCRSESSESQPTATPSWDKHTKIGIASAVGILSGLVQFPLIDTYAPPAWQTFFTYESINVTAFSVTIFALNYLRKNINIEQRIFNDPDFSKRKFKKLFAVGAGLFIVGTFLVTTLNIAYSPNHISERKFVSLMSSMLITSGVTTSIVAAFFYMRENYLKKLSKNHIYLYSTLPTTQGSAPEV